MSRVCVKMCGMTQVDDIAYAAQLGVDAIGLIFSDKSPRAVSLDQAKKLLAALPPFLDVVAVFVSPSVTLVQQIINELSISLLQFHGDESEAFCRQFHKPYIKAVQAHSTQAISQCATEHRRASAILVDSPSVSSYGGTGKTFDWGLVPKHLALPLMLAGGLDAMNVKEAVGRCSPYAVDVCSGVEASQGVKDHVKMKQFIDAVWGRT